MRTHVRTGVLDGLLAAVLAVGAVHSETVPAIFDVPASEWSRKSNTQVRLESRDDGQETILTFTFDPTDFHFGWVHRMLPEGDYTALAGVHGFFRGEAAGRLVSHVIMGGGDGQPPSYFEAEIGRLQDSGGEWLEFFVQFGQFVYQRGPVSSFSAAGLGPSHRLQFLLTTVAREPTTIALRNVRFVTREQSASMGRRLAIARLERLLLPAERIAENVVHPRLLLTRAGVADIERRATEYPAVAASRLRLLQHAERALDRVNPAAPFGDLLDYHETTELSGHERRARFEGRLRPLVTPVVTLAAAYRLTGDPRFGRHAAAALQSMARDLTVHDAVIDEGFYYTRTFYVRALAFGYDWLWDLLSPEGRRTIKTTLLGFILDIHARGQTHGWGKRPLHRVWNWDPGLMGACGVGFLALEGETRCAENAILFDCRRHLRDYLTLGIDADGCGHEGPSYIGYGIGAGVDFAEILRRQGRGDLFVDSNYRLIAPWIIAETLPDGRRWNNLSDCGHGQRVWPVYSYAAGRLAALAAASSGRDVAAGRWPTNACREPLDFLAQFREKPGDNPIGYPALAELMGWVWQTSLGKIDPAGLDEDAALGHVLYFRPCPVADDPAAYLPLGMHFRGRGLVVCRGGFGEEDWHLAVEAGPHAAGHDQSDKGTFTLRAYGADLAIDSGYGNDGDPEKSAGSQAHNVVLIDGQGQPMRNHNRSSGRITGFEHGALLDWIRVDAKDAWSIRYDHEWRPTETTPVERAERTLVLVREGRGIPSYLVVQDDIVKDNRERDYTWQWHIPASMTFDTRDRHWQASPSSFPYSVLTSTAESNGRAVFRFQIERGGAYRLAGLVRAGGIDVGTSDSFFIQVDDGERLLWDLPGGAAMGWAHVQHRDAPEPNIFELSAGFHRVTVSKREPEAELARLLVMPADMALPMAPEAGADGAVMLTVEDAEMDPEQPFSIIPPGQISGPNVSLDVFPVRPLNGRVESDWFLTSREGSHPRLQYTVRHHDPRFIMVLFPRKNGMQPPTVGALEEGAGVGVQLTWPNAVDTIHFQRIDGSGMTRTVFQREHGDQVVNWTSD